MGLTAADTRRDSSRLSHRVSGGDSYLREYTSLGTGGGIYHFRDQVGRGGALLQNGELTRGRAHHPARAQILRGKPDAFFVLHCDLCSDFPLSGTSGAGLPRCDAPSAVADQKIFLPISATELLQFHGAHGDNRHATVMSVKAQKTQAKYYGCLVVGADDSVQHYVEKVGVLSFLIGVGEEGGGAGGGGREEEEEEVEDAHCNCAASAWVFINPLFQPETFVSTDINCGIYVFSPAIFDDIRLVFLRNHDSGADGDFQEEIWLERDIIPGLVSGWVGGWVGRWVRG